MFSILIVDDEATERDGLTYLLKDRFPFKVHQEPNGKRAWEYLQRERVDVLLTDIKMPFMDGLELSQLVCEFFPETIIIIFSAYSEFEYAKRAMQAKAIHYLLKPIEVNEFNGLLRHVSALCQQKAEERMQKARQDENRKQLALMRLLSCGGGQVESQVKELHQCGIALEQQYLRLLHLEAQGDYFAAHDDRFGRLCGALCSYEHICVSFYPNSAYLLLLSNTLIHNQDAAELSQRLCRHIRQMHGESISVLVSACVHGADALPGEAATLNHFRKRFYTAQGSVLFVHGFLLQDAIASTEVEAARCALETAIERRDLPEIGHRLGRLFDVLRQSRTLGSTYLHHILYDLMTRLYVRFDRYSSKALTERMDDMLDQTDVSQMEQAMLSLVQELAAIPAKDNDDKAASAVQKVLRIIRREYASPLSLDYLAERAGVTPSYLSYLFKQETSETLVKYLTDYRLTQARRMLEEDSIKVHQVAKACGYENASYFNRIFKAHYGVTPSAIRGQEE